MNTSLYKTSTSSSQLLVSGIPSRQTVDLYSCNSGLIIMVRQIIIKPNANNRSINHNVFHTSVTFLFFLQTHCFFIKCIYYKVLKQKAFCKSYQIFFIDFLKDEAYSVWSQHVSVSQTHRVSVSVRGLNETWSICEEQQGGRSCSQMDQAMWQGASSSTGTRSRLCEGPAIERKLQTLLSFDKVSVVFFWTPVLHSKNWMLDFT